MDFRVYNFVNYSDFECLEAMVPLKPWILTVFLNVLRIEMKVSKLNVALIGRLFDNYFASDSFVSIVDRYNGHLTAGDKGRRRSKYVLWKRQSSNGVKPSRRHLVSDPKASKVRY